MNAAASPGVWRLMKLLVQFRIRHARHAFWGAAGSSTRWVSLAALLLPVAYVGLFVSAFQVVGQRAAWPVQVATLAVVAGGLTMASLVSKLTGGDAIVAGTGENEFFLSRPVGLGRLVMARALASALLDVWGALFLFPVLVAAALVWRLGWQGGLVALLTSWLLQVILVALGQAVSVGLLGRLSLPRRRLLQTGLGLWAAASVATLWLVASFVLRQPARFVEVISPWAAAINASPLLVLVAPLQALKTSGAVSAALWLLALGGVAAVVVRAAGGLAARAAKTGWEDAALPFAPSAAPGASQRSGKPLSMAGKELRLLLRDRGRLVSLLAMPLLFVGVQTFGAVGLEAFGGDARRAALLAYSLAAYLATLGPLPHMQGERRAFWILRSVPVPLWRLMWGKTKAWLLLIMGFGGAAYWATVLLALPQAYARLVTWVLFGLVMLGCALVCVLAVGVGCNVADLSRDDRNALGPGAVYVFLMVAGLFNLALLREAELIWRTLLLYAAAVALVWMTGMQRAAQAFDPERRRALTPGDGALAAILLYAGTQLVVVAPTGLSPFALQTTRAVWAVMVCAGAALFMFSLRAKPRTKRQPVRLRAVARALLSLLVAATLMLGLYRQWGPVVQLAVILVVAEEVVFRGLLQRGLQQHFGPLLRHRAWAAALAFGVSSVATVSPFSLPAVLTQAVATMAYAVGGSLWIPVLARMATFVP